MLYVVVIKLWIYLTGKARYKIVFLKGRNAWVAKPILQGKDYTHLTHMLQDILYLRTHAFRTDTLTLQLQNNH